MNPRVRSSSDGPSGRTSTASPGRAETRPDRAYTPGPRGTPPPVSGHSESSDQKLAQKSRSETGVNYDVSSSKGRNQSCFQLQSKLCSHLHAFVLTHLCFKMVNSSPIIHENVAASGKTSLKTNSILCALYKHVKERKVSHVNVFPDLEKSAEKRDECSRLPLQWKTNLWLFYEVIRLI